MKQIIKRIFTVALACSMVIGSNFGTGTAGVNIAHAEEPMKINYSGFMANVGWSPVTDDNRLCQAPEGSFMTAFKANLLNQPEGMTGTVTYQVNLSGSGWLTGVENGMETGATEGLMPLESIKMQLTGQLEETYDIYYSVFQNGAWTAWSMNGAPSGIEGAGLRIDGIKVSVNTKNSGEPAPQPEPPKEALVISNQKQGKIDPSKPMIALTFDDGPNASVTNRILDVLERNGARATFFMVGNRVTGKANIASVKRMVDTGSQVGNHTFEHKTLTKLSTDAIKSQLSQANSSVAAAGGVSPVVMRPPGGAKNDKVLSAAGSLGMSSVMWNIDTLDWKTKDKQKTIDAVLNHVKDGDIVLMHDLYGATADAVEVIVPALIARGYQLVTVSELSSYRGGMKAGHSYGSFSK